MSYRRLVHEDQVDIYVDNHIETPNAECVKFEFGQYIDYTSGRTYAAKYSRYVSKYGPRTSIGVACYYKTPFP